MLVEHFIAKHAQRAGKRIDGIAPGVMEALQASDWPGNVRELENTIERAVVLSPAPMIGPDRRCSSLMAAARRHQDCRR